MCPRKGSHLTEEHKQKIREFRRGQPSPSYGHTWDMPEERKQIISKKLSGRKQSEETKFNIAKNQHLPYKLIIDGKQYTSIADASRQLNIPYGRLRILIKRPQQLKEQWGHTIEYIDK